MRRRYWISFFSVVLLTLALVPAVTLAAPPADVIPDQYIVVLRDDSVGVPAVADEHAQRYGVGLQHLYEHALKGYAATIPAARLAQVRADPRVAFVSEDRPVAASGQTLPTGINRIDGELSSTKAGDGTGSVNVAVAIIDSGIDIAHPDLNVVGGKNCVGGTNSFDDGYGHGTHVAGTVAARDNTAGVVGVAPGAPLYAVRVLDRFGRGSWSTLACGIDWVTANATSKGIKVANLSLGGAGSDDGNCGRSNSDALHTAICNSVAVGVTYVVSAGNSSVDLAGVVPAAYDEVLTVTAVADFNGLPGGNAKATCLADVDDTAADFSNFTTKGHPDEAHTIAAPGACIYSTWKGRSYNTMSGTSMASPHVAGAAALCISGACAGLSPSQIIAKLRSDAAGRDASYGFAEDAHRVTNSGSRYYGYLTYAGGY